MFNPEYCCCAIPLVNAGIYTLLTEQLVLGLLAGVLAIATPTIVGGYVPSYTPYIFAALCFIVAALQGIGFFGIFKEKTRLFRAYSLLNGLAFGCVFGITAALIGVSAANHKSAVSLCENTYFNVNGTSSTASGEGSALCEAFAWADVGIMGGLWLILLVVQSYLIFITRVYSTEQAEDHKKYRSIYSTNVEEFAMADRASRYNADAWDHRPSMESLHDPNGGYPAEHSGYANAPAYAHQRGESNGSMLEQQGNERYDDDPRYQQHPQELMHDPNYPPPGMPQGYHEQPGLYTEYPSNVALREQGPTPTMGGYTDEQAYNGGLRRPEDSRMHPAEGMFGRKSPRRG